MDHEAAHWLYAFRCGYRGVSETDIGAHSALSAAPTQTNRAIVPSWDARWMPESSRDRAKRWRRMATATLDTAKFLRERDDHRSCVSRVYYAAYQAATSAAIAHGDAGSFPPGWNNPSHEQLPGLVLNNDDLPLPTRRTIRTIRRELRSLREDSDYSNMPSFIYTQKSPLALKPLMVLVLPLNYSRNIAVIGPASLYYIYNMVVALRKNTPA